MKANRRNIPFGRPMLGDEEKQAVLNVLEGPILVHGPKAQEFESMFSRFTGAPNAISVSSCTAALHLAYFDLGIGPGDEVIVPAQTHTATAHAVEFTGAKPVFVDAELNTGNIDIEQIEAHITENTRAISIVHFLGLPVAMDRIVAIAQKYDLFVVEDCALAIGTRFQGNHAGLFGDVGCFSFYPVKHMTTAEGGMLITKDQKLAERIKKLRAFGVDSAHTERKIPGVYDVNMLGYNYRMNEIQAAIGIEQIKRIDGFLAKRRENHQVLQRELAQVDELSLFQSSGGDFISSYYCLSIVLDQSIIEKRYDIVRHLGNKGVGTSVYYPKPVPHFRYYKHKYGYNSDSFPNAARISCGSISLPTGPHLETKDMEYIAKTVKEALYEIRKGS